MKILTTITIDLNEYGINGYLKFQSMAVSEVEKYQERLSTGKEKEVAVLMEVVRNNFVEGEVDGEKFDKITDISVEIANDAALFIIGQKSVKKK